MTGDPGPQNDKQPEALTPDDPNATKPAPADDGGASLLARIPGGRTLLTVVAAIVAVSAIAATTWALARSGDETATPPVDDESGAVTFGPNQPDSLSSTSLPTLPTFPSAPSLPTFPTTTPTFPTAPTSQFSFPSASVPAPTYPAFPTSKYTPPTFPTSQFTYPTATYTPTPSTPTSTSPSKIEVVPEAPQAIPIKRCGTYGKLRFARTTGVKYALVVGDGKKGRYVVTASARKGYVIKEGATRRFAGNLGQYEECPLGLRKVSAARTGDDTGWAVKVRLWVPEDEDRALRVTYSFASDVTLESTRGAGWSCGSLVDGELSCSYTGDGTPPTLNARVTGDAPVGTVALYADDEQVDVRAFEAPKAPSD